MAITTAFGNLQNVGDDVIIDENKELTQFRPFEELTLINGSLRVSDNRKLLQIEGEEN